MNKDADMHQQILQAGTLFEHFDTREALFAQSGLVESVRAWQSTLQSQIDETRCGQSIDPDLGHESVYRDAAAGVAIVSAIVPFIEGTLAHGFRGLRERFHVPVAERNHPRWTTAGEGKAFWDTGCTYVSGKKARAGLLNGTFEIVDALGLSKSLPPKLNREGVALFEYRHHCFHYGYEWPLLARQKFGSKIEVGAWEDLFSCSSWSGQPWIFYPTTVLIEAGMALSREVIEFFESTRVNWYNRGWDRPDPTMTSPPDWLFKHADD